MTTEEKARAYDEALAIASRKHKIMVEQKSTLAAGLLEELFPQLRETEDERIRKEIIDFIQWAEDRGMTRHDYHQAKRPAVWIAYLEKQKEQKPAEVDERMKNDKHFLSICQHLETLISESKNEGAEESIDKDYRWLCEFYRKSRSASVEENYKKPEWSEEDKKLRDDVINSLCCYQNAWSDYKKEIVGKEIRKLKSLKSQYHGDVTMTEAYKMGKEAGIEEGRWRERNDMPKWRKMPHGYEIRPANVCSIVVDLLDVNGKCCGLMRRTVLQNGDKYLFLDDLKKLPKEDKADL